MRIILVLTLVGLFVGCSHTLHKPTTATTEKSDCHHSPHDGQQNFIVGYGSLMQAESRRKTLLADTPVYPVVVNGFERGWFTRGFPIGYSTTFLGIRPKAGSQLNAVLYAVSVDELARTDKRELTYCRTQVDSTDLMLLSQTVNVPNNAAVWIYRNHSDNIKHPSKQFPIVQSYVDIFMSGCMELAAQYQLPDFAKQCISTTTGWSKHWVNDRLYPRRPFNHQPNAMRIDTLLAQELSHYFAKIRIE